MGSALDRPHQRMTLAPGGQLDQAVGVDVGERDLRRLVRRGRVVDAPAAAPDQSPRVAAR